MATDPQGKFVYVTNETGDTVSIYAINSGTGALTLVNEVVAGDAPRGITVSR